MAQMRFSPRSALLCVFFLFTTNVLAVSAVLGVDLGTEYIKAALVKPGIPLEIVLTKDSRRKEISAVAFKPSQSSPKVGSYPERAYGSDAVALAARFPGDVYPNLKALLGLPTTDAVVQEYAARHPVLQLEASSLRGTAAFKSKAFSDKTEAWSVEELLAMELQSIQQNAEALAGPGTTVRSVVLTIPPFYTIEEKRAVELAAELAGLKVLSLITDGVAVGLNYATSRQFPNIDDGGKPEYHLVFDMGAGSTKATVLKFQSRTVKDVGKFNKTIQEVQVVGTGWDRTLGGDALNSLIVDDMISKFVESKGAQKVSATTEGVQKHGRAMAKLNKDAERLRHVLSANQNTQTSFEGLYDDVDFRYKVTRADFETLADKHAERVGAIVLKALDVAELDIKQIESVILFGGASRTPFVQKELEKIAGTDKLRSNVNSDEAAVFGAGFRAAELSPSFRVKEIRISEGSIYPAGMKWTNANGKAQQQKLWTERSFLGAVPKEITFTNHEDLTVNFFQQVPSADGPVDAETRSLTTKNLTASVNELKEKYSCADADIHFKVKLALAPENGEVKLLKAGVECEAETTEKEGSVIDGVKNLFGFGKKDQQPLKDGEEAESTGSSSTTTSTNTATTSFTETSSTSSQTTTSTSATTSEAPKTQRQLVVIPVDHIFEKKGIPQLPKADLSASKDRLKAFEASDRSRRLREETLNQLEGFTYKVRDLLDTEAFVAASTKEERTSLEQKSSDASDWLYGDGAEASREELKARLKGLQDIVTPVQKRIEEGVNRPILVKALKDALSQTETFVSTIKNKIVEAEALSSSSSSDTTETASTTTAAPSKSSGDFDGLEDDETKSTTATPKPSASPSGPVPPLYKMEDLTELTELAKAISEWLEEKLADQEKLPHTANPVLLAKDLSEKTKKLEQAGMDLAMKGVKNFESKNKKSGSKPKKTKKVKLSGTTTAGSEPTVDFGKDGENFIKFGKDGQISDEDLQELLKKVKAEEGQRKGSEKGEDKQKHDEL